MTLGGAELLFFVGFGFVVGVLFGFFGLGGSFFVTPALLVLGHPAEAAVGSGLVFVFGTSIVAAISHRSIGHVDYRLAGLLVVGMAFGIEIGRRVLFSLVRRGIADLSISVSYVVLLALVGSLVLWRTRADHVADTGGVDNRERLQRSRLGRFPPTIRVRSGVTVSVWLVLLVAVTVGTLSGFLGVGGGFLMVPSLVYGFGISKSIAVGTDILQIAGSSAFGSFVYLRADAVHFSVVVPLLGGSILGSALGSRLTDLVDEDELMGYFAVMLLLDSLAVASKTVSHAYGIAVLHDLSITLLFGTAVVVSATVVYSAGHRLLARTDDVDDVS